MYNQVASQLRLVQTEIVKAAPVFGRMLSAVDGYSLEVFRGETYLGSVRTSHGKPAAITGQEFVKMRVYNGDVIYKVNIVRQSVPVIGHLMTKDKYIRSYDLTIDLIVSNSLLFIQGYRLDKDPANIAIERFKSSLQDYASRTEHDKLIKFEQLGDAWNNALCAETGVKITRISRWNVWKDPKYEAALRIQKEAEIRRLEDSFRRERDAEEREHKRREAGKQNVFDREEATRQRMHDLHMTLREAAAQELTDILRERIRYAFESGTPINEVAEDSLKLLNAFHESLQRGNVVDSTLSEGPRTSVNDTSPEEETNVASDPVTEAFFYTPPSGVDPVEKAQEETNVKHDPMTDPSLYTSPDITDLGKAQKEADEE